MGGTEEEIIARGSEWCTDVARAACALFQVAGFAARLVYLFDTAAAYNGHAMVEVQREGRWGAVDPTFGAIYRHPEGVPASVWNLMNEPMLHAAPPRRDLLAPEAPSPISLEQFRAAAPANYFIWQRASYDYTVSAPNAYYRAILDVNRRGWPGGLRWIHGEDTVA